MNTTSTILTKDIAVAAEMLRTGRLVAFPTETVYGLGADARNARAVAGIFEAKRRPSFDPLIVHVTDIAAVEKLTIEFPPQARALAESFWPGPLTLVLPKTDEIPDLVTAGLPAVGLRIPSHPVAAELLKRAGCPVAAPSANVFGQLSPTTAAHVMDGLGDRIDCVVDGGPCVVGLESTVVAFPEKVPIVLRPGGLAIEAIESVIGRIAIANADPSRDNSAQPAPGMLSRHYAPRTPLTTLHAETVAVPSGARWGLLTYGNCEREPGFAHVETLSKSQDLSECAANFFAALGSLDSSDLDVIIAHRFPDRGLGLALNNRLERASQTIHSHGG